MFIRTSIERFTNHCYVTHRKTQNILLKKITKYSKFKIFKYL